MKKCKIFLTTLFLFTFLIISVTGCTTTASKTQQTPTANSSLQAQTNESKQNTNEQNKNKTKGDNVIQNANIQPNIIEKYHIIVSNQPFSSYPTEKQILAQPDGNIKINGIQARSFGHGMEVTWKDKNWEYFAIGPEYGAGKQMVQEILNVLPNENTLVKNSIKGKLRFEQLGNPTYYTASWTYDGEKWYTLHGKGLPKDAIGILQSIK